MVAIIEMPQNVWHDLPHEFYPPSDFEYLDLTSG
jgi:hypothetical protein